MPNTAPSETDQRDKKQEYLNSGAMREQLREPLKLFLKAHNPDTHNPDTSNPDAITLYAILSAFFGDNDNWYEVLKVPTENLDEKAKAKLLRIQKHRAFKKFLRLAKKNGEANLVDLLLPLDQWTIYALWLTLRDVVMSSIYR